MSESAETVVQQAKPTAEADVAETAGQLALDAKEAEPGAASGEPDDAAEASGEDVSRLDRRKLEEQLDALKRRESELRRALAIADHPELEDAIRLLEGRAYGVSRVEVKMAQGLSKSEERRKGTLETKMASLLEKRAQLDAQIAEIQTELDGMGVDRTRAYALERKEALQLLIACLGTHEAALRAAGLEASELVPELSRWMPEVEALAKELAKGTAGPRAN